MTDAEMRVALQLVDEEHKAWLDQVREGRWILANERGVYCVSDKKAVAIEYALTSRGQKRENCKVKRNGKGVYELSVLDIDEDPAEKFYHTYVLERITAENIREYKEIVLCGILPDEYFDCYSVLYSVMRAFTDGKLTEEQVVQRLKDLEYIPCIP